MKTKILQVFMILVIAIAGIYCASVSFAEQAARYAAEQEGKHIFLAQTKEDMNALRSCLIPLYRTAARPEFTPASSDVSTVMPSAKMVPSIVQPNSTAIAASPRPEIITGSEDKK